MKKLILLRGPSGTGKSTIAHFLKWGGLKPSMMAKLPDCHIHETDTYFIGPDGEYKFDADMLGSAHQWNLLQVERSMFFGVKKIIVANTFISHWEMKSYLAIGKGEYEIEIIRTPGPWDAEVSFGRNKHDVPFAVLQRHISKYQKHDNEIEWEDLSIFNSNIWTVN